MAVLPGSTRTWLALWLVFVCTACRTSTQDEPAKAVTADTPPTPSTSADPSFEARLVAIAQSYQRYDRIQVRPRWALLDCVSPFKPTPEGDLHFSEISDESAHGRKVYYLFASLPRYYLHDVKQDDKSVTTAPVGQTLVKEAWTAIEVKDKIDPLAKLPADQIRYAGQVYKAGSKAGLYIMTKLDTTTPDTDEGWLYGVVGADGKTVEASGRIDRCIKCHKNAPHDRLFGFP